MKLDGYVFDKPDETPKETMDFSFGMDDMEPVNVQWELDKDPAAYRDYIRAILENSDMLTDNIDNLIEQLDPSGILEALSQLMIRCYENADTDKSIAEMTFEEAFKLAKNTSLPDDTDVEEILDSAISNSNGRITSSLQKQDVEDFKSAIANISNPMDIMKAIDDMMSKMMPEFEDDSYDDPEDETIEEEKDDVLSDNLDKFVDRKDDYIECKTFNISDFLDKFNINMSEINLDILDTDRLNDNLKSKISSNKFMVIEVPFEDTKYILCATVYEDRRYLPYKFAIYMNADNEFDIYNLKNDNFYDNGPVSAEDLIDESDYVTDELYASLSNSIFGVKPGERAKRKYSELFVEKEDYNTLAMLGTFEKDDSITKHVGALVYIGKFKFNNSADARYFISDNSLNSDTDEYDLYYRYDKNIYCEKDLIVARADINYRLKLDNPIVYRNTRLEVEYPYLVIE